MRKVTVIADMLLENFSGTPRPPGGAELHDQVVIDRFASEGILDECINSVDVTPEMILSKKDNIFFLGNFFMLRPDDKAALYSNCDYVIYEHDYKFCKNRNPIHFPNFKAPNWALTNINFYRQAKKVITLSKMHREIFEKNLNLEHNLTNINCSMWSDKHLDILSALAKTEKTKPCAIIGSGKYNAHIKRTDMAIDFCQKNNLKYEIISDPNYEKFLKKLSDFETLIFMTGHPEPTPRLVMEAKMMNCKVVAQKHLIGVAHEDYFELSGQELIERVRQMRDTALNDVILPEVGYEV